MPQGPRVPSDPASSATTGRPFTSAIRNTAPASHTTTRQHHCEYYDARGRVLPLTKPFARMDTLRQRLLADLPIRDHAYSRAAQPQRTGTREPKMLATLATRKHNNSGVPQAADHVRRVLFKHYNWCCEAIVKGFMYCFCVY